MNVVDMSVQLEPGLLTNRLKAALKLGCKLLGAWLESGSSAMDLLGSACEYLFDVAWPELQRDYEEMRPDLEQVLASSQQSSIQSLVALLQLMYIILLQANQDLKQLRVRHVSTQATPLSQYACAATLPIQQPVSLAIPITTCAVSPQQPITLASYPTTTANKSLQPPPESITLPSMDAAATVPPSALDVTPQLPQGIDDLPAEAEYVPLITPPPSVQGGQAAMLAAPTVQPELQAGMPAQPAPSSLATPSAECAAAPASAAVDTETNNLTGSTAGQRQQAEGEEPEQGAIFIASPAGAAQRNLPRQLQGSAQSKQQQGHKAKGSCVTPQAVIIGGAASASTSVQPVPEQTVTQLESQQHQYQQRGGQKVTWAAATATAQGAVVGPDKLCKPLDAIIKARTESKKPKQLPGAAPLPPASASAVAVAHVSGAGNKRTRHPDVVRQDSHNQKHGRGNHKPDTDLAGRHEQDHARGGEGARGHADVKRSPRPQAHVCPCCAQQSRHDNNAATSSCPPRQGEQHKAGRIRQVGRRQSCVATAAAQNIKQTCSAGVGGRTTRKAGQRERHQGRGRSGSKLESKQQGGKAEPSTRNEQGAGSERNDRADCAPIDHVVAQPLAQQQGQQMPSCVQQGVKHEHQPMPLQSSGTAVQQQQQSPLLGEQVVTALPPRFTPARTSDALTADKRLDSVHGDKKARKKIEFSHPPPTGGTVLGTSSPASAAFHAAAHKPSEVGASQYKSGHYGSSSGSGNSKRPLPPLAVAQQQGKKLKPPEPRVATAVVGGQHGRGSSAQSRKLHSGNLSGDGALLSGSKGTPRWKGQPSSTGVGESANCKQSDQQQMPMALPVSHTISIGMLPGQQGVMSSASCGHSNGRSNGEGKLPQAPPLNPPPLVNPAAFVGQLDLPPPFTLAQPPLPNPIALFPGNLAQPEAGSKLIPGIRLPSPMLPQDAWQLE